MWCYSEMVVSLISIFNQFILHEIECYSTFANVNVLIQPLGLAYKPKNIIMTR